MKYILRHSFIQFLGMQQTGPYEYTQNSTLICKNLLFHNIETMYNYIRLNVSAATLRKLEVEILTVE